jgi:hypothetical protein
VISHYLSSLTGSEYVGQVSLLLSVLAFLLIVVRVFLINRERIDHLERLPFDDDVVRGREVTL